MLRLDAVVHAAWPHGGAGEDDEIGGLAPLERQFLDALVLDGLADA
jgi:hypothetical protein